MSQSIILKIHKSGLPDEKFIFEENGAYIIGRAPSCALSLSNELDGKISRRHLLLNLEDSGVRIRDIGSRNGTEVNGETLPKGGIGKIPEALTPEDRKLKPGDIVAMGDTTWTFDFFSQTEVSTNSNQDAPTSVSPSSAEDMSDSKQDAIGMPTLTGGMPALPVAKLADEPEKRPESIQLNAPASPSTSKTALENSALEEAPTRKLKVPGIKPAPPLHSLETKAPVAAPPKESEPAGIAPSPSQPPSAKPEEEKTLRKKSPTTPIVLSKKTKHSKPPVAGDNAAAPKPPLDGKLKLKNEDLQQEAPNAKDLESIAKKDVLEKLGTFDDTVEMEPEEFDNLDDLVFGVSREKPDKRTTKFKIKSPNPPKPSVGRSFQAVVPIAHGLARQSEHLDFCDFLAFSRLISSVSVFSCLCGLLIPSGRMGGRGRSTLLHASLRRFQPTRSGMQFRHIMLSSLKTLSRDFPVFFQKIIAVGRGGSA